MKQQNLRVVIILNEFNAVPTREGILRTMQRDISTGNDVEVYINDTENIQVLFEEIPEKLRNYGDL
jgi:hypothetical protein